MSFYVSDTLYSLKNLYKVVLSKLQIYIANIHIVFPSFQAPLSFFKSHLELKNVFHVYDLTISYLSTWNTKAKLFHCQIFSATKFGLVDLGKNEFLNDFQIESSYTAYYSAKRINKNSSLN